MTSEYTPAQETASGRDVTVSMTYAELVAAIAANALITGQTIVLTDFQTSHYIQYTDTPGNGTGNDELVHLGAIEPLVLRASSNNTLDEVAYSPSKPQDVMTYLVTLPDCTWDYAAASGKGVIIKRKDRVSFISRDYDFRNVIFRRWNDGAGHYIVVRKADAPDPTDFLDFNCYDLAGNIPIRSNVNSPLALRASIAADNGVLIPYWLDNTVVKTEAIFQDNDLGVSFANTFEGSGLVTVREIKYNTFQIFLWNELNRGYGDATSINHILSNQIHSVVQNGTRGVIIDNQINLLKNNLNSGLLVGNISDSIMNNGQGSNVTDILRNNVANIDSNFNTGVISNNTGRVISGNISSVINILSNNVNEINSNANNGSISSNTGEIIQGNTNNGGIISNNVRQITNNSNGGNIETNTGNFIIGNSGTGLIVRNNVTAINANTCGNILENTGYQIFANTITGTILGNSVNYMYNNGQASASSINFCNGENLYDSTLAGDLISCELRIGTCVFDATCKDHNFIDGITNKNISPNADMQSSTYTRSIFDEGSAQWVQMIVTGGVITFSAAFTS